MTLGGWFLVADLERFLLNFFVLLPWYRPGCFPPAGDSGSNGQLFLWKDEIVPPWGIVGVSERLSGEKALGRGCGCDGGAEEGATS